MKKTALKLIMASFAVIVLLACLKADTTTVQAATKRISGGRSMKTAKKVSKSNSYIVKVKGDQSLWYKFKTPKYSTYFSYYAKNLSSTGSFRLYLYSKDEEELVESYSMGKNSESQDGYSVPLKKNTWYYINLDSWDGKGNIKFSFGLKRDDVPNSMKKARTIKCNKNYINSIDGKYDEDWFKFKPKESGNYTFTLKNIGNEYSIKGYVISKYEEELDSVYVWNNSDDSFSVKLKKNQYYYIKIESKADSGKTGKYRFSIK